MKIKLLFACIFFTTSLFGQTDTSHFIKIHFLYGSKPLKKYKSTEAKYVGGIHGGHVTIEVDSIDYGFSPEGRIHLFPHKHKSHCRYEGRPTHNQPPYSKGYKVTTFIIPVSDLQYHEFLKINAGNCNNPPYDYAFFGMRCAASAEDVLEQIGIVKKRNRFKNIRTTFYPKKLRKRMFKLAADKNYVIIKQEGRVTRKWESD
ncbi:MAG: hypothetical protein ACXVPU_09800 [Bacteroidia bacterium]